VTATEADLAEQVVALVREVAGPAAEAEVCVGHVELALTRFANSAIHQNVAEATTTVRLRLHLDGRTAVGSTTVASGDGLRDLVQRTTAAARACPPDPGWPGLAPPALLAGPGDWDDPTAHAGPDARADRVRKFVDAAGGLTTAGYCRTVLCSAAFASSAGQSLAARTSEAAMDAIARLDGADGVARLSSARLADIDGAVLGRRAAAKARACAAPVDLPPGRYEVVLEPPAVADLLVNLSMAGFNGKAWAERRSFAEPGVAQFDPAVTLVDDVLAAGRPGLPFDAEGTPGRRLVLVEAGVTRAVAHDRRSAAKVGAASTGHATPGAARLGAFPSSFALLPARAGGTASDADTARTADDTPVGAAVDPAAAALVAGVARGLLVTDLWYTRVLDPKSLVVTGLTRNGVWLVEDGELTRPVTNLRFTQSYPLALAPGAVLGLGPVATTLPGDGSGSSWTAPALHLASWHMSGGAGG